MSGRAAPRIAGSAFALCCLLFGSTALLTWSTDGDQGGLSIDLAMVATAGVGALVAARRPDNPIGWLLSASGLVWVLSTFGQQYAAASFRTELPAAGAIFWLVHLWGLSAVLLVLATILFPDGRLPSPRWRPVVWIALLDAAVLFAAARNVAGPLTAALPLDRWFGADLGERLSAVGPSAGGLLLIALLLSAVAALVVRLRRASGVERQQLKWVAFGFAFCTALFIGTTELVFSPFGRSVFGEGRIPAEALPLPYAVGFAALPISMGVAILRHRLYDIDILINRTLVYGALSAVLAATYFVTVLAFETVLRPLTAGSEVAVALSTLAVVALFAPLRRRIQDGVDQRFFRAKYDAVVTLDAFAARLRDEVDLEAVRVSLLGAVGRTVQPASASLWLRERRS